MSVRDGQFRWRKFSPLDRDSPIYELLDGDVIILDVAQDKSGNLEIAFHEGASGRILELAILEQLLAEAKRLLAPERPPAGK